ncbi:wnt ligand secretion mediator isoform X1 [Tachypleus tridentatus]|uniref:wnt ligand secretion mediator isoform X1 n=1 Tax=Tachypleus tridentatus TaxID=6853 RepID=UPI003FD11942
MGGTILENLSGRKLAVLVCFVLLCQIACFLIGGCIAPAPSNVENVLGTKCLVDTSLPPGTFHEHWHIPRGRDRRPINCHPINNLNSPEAVADERITPNKIVFAFQIPNPKVNHVLDYSRWMQNLIGVLHIEVLYKENIPIAEKPILSLDVKLGYRNKWDPDDKYMLIAKSTEKRYMSCTIEEKRKIEGYQYDCDLLPLFELGSLHHDFYLINLRLPVSESNKEPINEGIGQIEDINVVVINQNGGFTKVWVSLKTVFFPVIIGLMIWFWHRILLLPRPPALLEKMLLILGIALSVLNLPLEFLTLWVELPFMLLLSDIRQGFFYAALLSFWLIFCGEHLMDEVARGRVRSYWKHLSAVGFGCLCLFIFDMCERGVQLKNPFYSIWVTDLGTNLALVFIILAALSASLYFVFLCYMVFQVVRNISYKRTTLPTMSSTRRLFYEGIIYRFNFLMLATLLCAAMTVISYIIGQVSEGHWKWDEDMKLEYTSAFLTGVYGMWNLYVFTLLILYAPSHKSYPPAPERPPSSQEEVEFSRLTTSDISPTEPSEMSSLTEFARKAALD